MFTSNVIKLNPKSRSIRVKVLDDFEVEKIEKPEPQVNRETLFQIELEKKVKEGYEKGWQESKNELEDKYTKQLIDKSEEFNAILRSIQENLSNYESAFDGLVIKTAIKIAEKILRIKAGDEEVIRHTLQESLKKIIQANDVIIRIHPDDYELLFAVNHENSVTESFKNIKYEKDERIERGGCFVETEIGNVDARLSTQLTEIQTALESALLTESNTEKLS